MHLRTIVIALALCWAAFGQPAAAQLHAQAAERPARETVGRVAGALEPFLASGGFVLEAPAEHNGSGAQPAQRLAQSRTSIGCAPVDGQQRITHLRARRSGQCWTDIGPREHHLGTPPPA